MDTTWSVRLIWAFVGACILAAAIFVVAMFQELRKPAEPSEVAIPIKTTAITPEVRIVEIPRERSRVIDIDHLNAFEDQLRLVEMFSDVPVGSTTEVAFLEQDPTRVLVVVRTKTGRDIVFELQNLTNTGFARYPPPQLAVRGN